MNNMLSRFVDRFVYQNRIPDRRFVQIAVKRPDFRCEIMGALATRAKEKEHLRIVFDGLNF